MTTHRVVIAVGPQGMGSVEVAFPTGSIEMVRVLQPHGHPHVLNSANPGCSILEVLGAVPDSEVTVEFRVPA